MKGNEYRSQKTKNLVYIHSILVSLLKKTQGTRRTLQRNRINDDTCVHEEIEQNGLVYLPPITILANELVLESEDLQVDDDLKDLET